MDRQTEERAANIADRVNRRLQKALAVALRAEEWEEYRKLRRLWREQWGAVFFKALAKFKEGK